MFANNFTQRKSTLSHIFMAGGRFTAWSEGPTLPQKLRDEGGSSLGVYISMR